MVYLLILFNNINLLVLQSLYLLICLQYGIILQDQQIMKDSKKSLAKTINAFRTSPKSDNSNSLSTGKYINNQITSFQLGTPCLVHVSETISHICQNCQYRPLCGLCLQQGKHKSHSVKNVQKATKIVHRYLIEALITIRQKSNLLCLLESDIQSKKTQIKSQFQQFINAVNQNFDILQQTLTKKRDKIVNALQQAYRKEQQKIELAYRQTKQQNQRFRTMIQIISQKTQKLDGSYLCMYYFQKKLTLQQSLEDSSSIVEQLKKKIVDFKWIIQNSPFDQIKQQIDNVRLQLSQNKIQINSDFKYYKDLKKSYKKQNCFTKEGNNEKMLNTIQTTGFWTPKNIQSQKMYKKVAKDLKDSKKLLTLISSDSIQKINKNIESPNMLLKKGKNKIKFEKNS